MAQQLDPRNRCAPAVLLGPPHPCTCRHKHPSRLAACALPGTVPTQVLQTLSIIIQNVRSQTGIFFLFSNNHINNIVDLDFDFSDDEVLGYYISFLKTISLKLNSGESPELSAAQLSSFGMAVVWRFAVGTCAPSSAVRGGPRVQASLGSALDCWRAVAGPRQRCCRVGCSA